MSDCQSALRWRFWNRRAATPLLAYIRICRELYPLCVNFSCSVLRLTSPGFALPFPSKNLNDLTHAATGHFTPKQYGLI